MTILTIDGSITLHRAKHRVASAAKALYDDLLNRKMSEIVRVQRVAESITPAAMMSVFFSILPNKIEEFRASRIYVLWDEGRCHYRVNLNPDYKLARNQKPKTFIDHHCDDAYKLARAYLHENLPKIGAASILIPGVEADDIAYYISHTYPSGVLMSDDKDWFLNLREGWSLCRPMQRGDNLTNYKQFDSMMKGGKHCEADARTIYVYQKALQGDKDEIPRITTPVPAKRLSDYIVGLSQNLSERDRELLDQSADNIKRNVLLAETDWLIRDPKICDMQEVMTKAHSAVEVGNLINFMQFAGDTQSFAYSSRWNTISQRLSY